MIPGLYKKTAHNSRLQIQRRTRSIVIALARQDGNMNKREKWTESDIEELPTGEQDYFERKSGLLFQNRGEFLDTIAKAISAFSNSGGGHLIIGVNDNGILDGLPPEVGNTTIKDWLEQKIPNLVDYPISDFRVHQVIRANPSRIPQNHEVVVIDVGDSPLAPHQSARDKKYYYRSGGRSEPAPQWAPQ
jgi:predicted HTH transcriptional regulator